LVEGPQSGEHWLWTGATSKGGYGQFKIGGHARYAHALAWELRNGPVPDGMRLTRHPDCPKNCVRSDHWRPATYSAAHTNGGPVMTLVKPPR
jgi:hypothetical protein